MTRPPIKLVEMDPAGTALSSAAGGGTYDGMEPRVAQLEADMKVVRSDLAYIRGKLDALPTGKDFADIRGEIGVLRGEIGFVRGKINRLPTFAKLSALAALAAGFIALLPKIQAWLAMLPF